MMTMVAYWSGMRPSLNLSLKVPCGLCSLARSQLKRSMATWLTGTASSTVIKAFIHRSQFVVTHATAAAPAHEARTMIQM